MRPHTLRLVLDKAAGHGVRLATCVMDEISPGMWEDLARSIATEPTLMPCSASLLAERCREGFAAAAVHYGRIVSFIALVPIVHPAARGAPSWQTLCAGVGLPDVSLPTASVFSFTNSWTAPEWRRRGISLVLRRPLIERHLSGENLGILDMDGLASPVPARLGWRIMAWERVPFLSSLLSIPGGEFAEQASEGWTSPLGLRRYQGPHVPLGQTGHPWQEYFHFWASDEAQAERLDEQIRALFCGDVRRWRLAILSVFEAPEMLWKVAFD